MSRMANRHDVGEEKRVALRGANNEICGPLPCEVVSYNRLATPAVASNKPSNYFLLYFLRFVLLHVTR